MAEEKSFALDDTKHAALGEQLIRYLTSQVRAHGGNFNDSVLVLIKALACSLALGDTEHRPTVGNSYEEEGVLLLKSQYAAHLKSLNEKNMN